jgi:hypothetical protein
LPAGNGLDSSTPWRRGTPQCCYCLLSPRDCKTTSGCSTLLLLKLLLGLLDLLLLLLLLLLLGLLDMLLLLLLLLLLKLLACKVLLVLYVCVMLS